MQHRPRLAVEAAAAVGILVATLVPYLGNPGSGFNWGSRYLVPAIPLFVALAWAVPTRRWIAPLGAVVGVIIVLPTFVTFYQRAYAEQAIRGVVPEEVYWSVTRAPIARVWGAAGRTIEASRGVDVKRLANEPDTPADGATVSGQKLYRVIAQWWWMTPAAAVPRFVGLLCAFALLLAGAVLLLSRPPATA